MVSMQSPFENIFKLHGDKVPAVFKEQFLYTSDDPYLLVLEGEMLRVWHRPAWLKPLFWLMGKIGVFIPYTGENIPTRVEIRSGIDHMGQPFHSFNRHLDFPKPFSFNTVMLFDFASQELAERLGPKKMLLMTWKAEFSEPDRFSFQTKGVALQFGKKRVILPRWIWIWLGEVFFQQKALTNNTTRIKLLVKHPIFGAFFGYTGVFEVKKKTALR